jgi:hypothetical protein
MADDRTARDAEIRRRLEAEAERTEAVLRELAQSARSPWVRTGARATLRRLSGSGDAQPRTSRVTPEAIEQMRNVARELAKYRSDLDGGAQ